MTMSLADFNRLKAFMNTTESGADAEVLTAIKRANGMLVKYGYTWDAVFKKLVVIGVEEAPDGGGPPATTRGAGGDDLKSLFAAALENVKPGSFRDMLLDIHAKYERGIRLSEKQIGVVRKAASSGSR